MKFFPRVCLLGLACAWAVSASAGEPPQPEAASSTQAAQPDDSLIEFLGSDDTDDTQWWEFLKKRETKGKQPRERADEPAPDQSQETPQDSAR